MSVLLFEVFVKPTKLRDSLAIELLVTFAAAVASLGTDGYFLKLENKLDPVLEYATVSQNVHR